jgi:site-specific DNA-methyltransferase (adenine-specific)/modification methylase
MTYSAIEKIGDCTLYLADCTELLPDLAQFDALVTDPPYGLGEGGKMGNPKRRSKIANADKYGDFAWDDKRADAAVALAQSICTYQIIWGGNYYDLGPSRGYLVWNKLNSGDFADCELAWSNLDQAVRKIDLLWNGMIRAEKHIERVHPTQKPVGVMQFCLDQLPNEAHTVLDPFMGSGTTGVACVNSGKQFVGIERERSYFDMACQRMQDAVAQPQLFTVQVSVPKQEPLI